MSLSPTSNKYQPKVFSYYSPKMIPKYLVQGRIQDLEKGGHNYVGHGNCVRSTQSGMGSMPNLRGSKGMPPQEILKIKPSEIESEGIFNRLLSLLLQDSTLIAQ